MEAEQESSKNIVLFWSLLNKGLQNVTGGDKMVFHPQGWRTDMARANMNGRRQVFSDDASTHIKSCEFNFKESINKMARKLGQEAGESFKELPKISSHVI